MWNWDKIYLLRKHFVVKYGHLSSDLVSHNRDMVKPVAFKNNIHIQFYVNFVQNNPDKYQKRLRFEMLIERKNWNQLFPFYMKALRVWNLSNWPIPCVSCISPSVKHKEPGGTVLFTVCRLVRIQHELLFQTRFDRYSVKETHCVQFLL